MNEQNTGSDLGKNFESQLQTETLSKLQGMGLNEDEAKAILIQEASDKLDSLKGDFLSEVQKSTNSKDKAEAALAQLEGILSEYKSRLAEHMLAERQALSMKIKNSQKKTESFASASLQTTKTIGNFGLEAVVGIKDFFLHPIASVQYMYSKADGIISDEDLNYKIT